MCYFCEIQHFNIEEYIQSNKDRLRNSYYLGEISSSLHILASKERTAYENVTYPNEPIIDMTLKTKSNAQVIIIENKIEYHLSIRCPFLTKLPEITTNYKLVLSLQYNKLDKLSLTNDQLKLIELTLMDCDIKQLELKNINKVIIISCNLKEINKLNDIKYIRLSKNEELHNIKEVKNVDTLEIYYSPKLTNTIKLIVCKIENCINLMNFLKLVDNKKINTVDYNSVIKSNNIL